MRKAYVKKKKAPVGATNFKTLTNAVDRGEIDINEEITQEFEAPQESSVRPRAIVVENKKIMPLTGGDTFQKKFDICQKVIREENELKLRDPVSEMVGNKFFRTNEKFDWCKNPHTGQRYGFSRHYLDIGMLIDFFKSEGPKVDEEVTIKKSLCEENGFYYVAVPNRQNLTIEMVRRATEEAVMV